MAVWRAVLQLLRAIWRRLCGYCQAALHHHQHHTSADRTEHQQLLGGPDASRSSTPSTGGLPLLEPAVLPATLIVMRHGHRQDEEDPFWHQTAARPWDPPLSAKGKTQAAEAPSRLSGMTVDYVISSPFKRCLQTSAGLVRGLTGLKEGHWLVDWQLAEVCEPRVLFGMRADSQELATGANVEAWMWGGGTQTDAALDKFAREDCRLQPLPLRPVARRHKPTPVYPEDLEQGLGRYSRAMQEIARSFAGHTVLLVTHGECVRQAVLMAEPSSEVFEVQHTGFVVLQHTPQQQQQQQQQHVAPKASSWRLTSACGETGVLWLEDD